MKKNKIGKNGITFIILGFVYLYLNFDNWLIIWNEFISGDYEKISDLVWLLLFPLLIIVGGFQGLFDKGQKKRKR